MSLCTFSVLFCLIFDPQNGRTSCGDEKNLHLPSVDGANTAIPWTDQVKNGYHVLVYACVS